MLRSLVPKHHVEVYLNMAMLSIWDHKHWQLLRPLHYLLSCHSRHIKAGIPGVGAYLICWALCTLLGGSWGIWTPFQTGTLPAFRPEPIDQAQVRIRPMRFLVLGHSTALRAPLGISGCPQIFVLGGFSFILKRSHRPPAPALQPSDCLLQGLVSCP